MPERTVDLAPVLSFLSAHERRRGRTLADRKSVV